MLQLVHEYLNYIPLSDSLEYGTELCLNYKYVLVNTAPLAVNTEMVPRIPPQVLKIA